LDLFWNSLGIFRDSFGNYLWNFLRIVIDCLDLLVFIDLFVKILFLSRFWVKAEEGRKEEIHSLEVREASSSNLKISKQSHSNDCNIKLQIFKKVKTRNYALWAWFLNFPFSMFGILASIVLVLFLLDEN
jgi:hypothetical protein